MHTIENNSIKTLRKHEPERARKLTKICEECINSFIKNEGCDAEMALSVAGSIISTGLINAGQDSVIDRDLEKARICLDEVKSSVLNALAEQGWQ